MANDPECPLLGNPDLYGLGIRTSLYMAYLSSMLSKMSHSSTLSTKTYMTSGQLVFSLAFFVVMARESARSNAADPTLHAVEALIGVCLLGPSLSSAMEWGAVNRSTATLNALVMALVLGELGYCAWFWFRGLDVLPGTGECGTEYAFFFARVELRGWFRTLSQVTICLQLAQTAWGTLKTWVYSLAICVMAADDIKTQEGMPARGTRIIFNSVQAIFIVFFIAMTEMTIRWNNITGVDNINSTSQFVAFLLGLGQLVYVAYKTFLSDEANHVRGREGHDSAAHAGIKSECREKAKRRDGATAPGVAVV